MHVVVYACVYSLLCLREGEAEGEETEVRGAGMGHLRTGSSTILLLSISSIKNSTETRGEKMKGEAGRGEKTRGQEENVVVMGGEGGGGRKSISEAFYWIDIIAPPSAW